MRRQTLVMTAFFLIAFAGLALAGEWTGEVMKKDGKWWFKSGEKTYSITNPEKITSAEEGKKVKITGTMDAATKSLTVKSLAPAAAAS